jgi:hypothetical protein
MRPGLTFSCDTPSASYRRPGSNPRFFYCLVARPHTHHASIANLDKPNELHNPRRYGFALVGGTRAFVYK